MGGDAGTVNAFSYVRINGTVAATAPLTITSWSHWDTALIPAFTCAPGDKVEVGIHVECSGAGAWGKIDCATVNSTAE